MTAHVSIWNSWRTDLPSALVVFLVALPLCLGIALASGAPLFSGIIAGVVGGVVVGSISRSAVSVSGPAAGLTVIVLAAIQSLPSYESFLLAVVLGGMLQVGLSVARAGVIGDFIPSSVIKGMLAAIGLILILKQVPHAVGYDADYLGDQSFWQPDGENTFSTLWRMLDSLSLGAVVISSISLAFLFLWDARQPKFTHWLRYLPGPLVVVLFGVAANLSFQRFAPELALDGTHLVTVPVAESFGQFISLFTLPDFSAVTNQDVWMVAITLALVASVETLLSIEASDKLDPHKRVTPTNRELLAQGVGNMTSGLIGGLPVTSVIVRSSANVSAGAQSRLSTICHGLLLLVCVMAIPGLLNLIPLSALAAVLIAVGYKLTKPSIFLQKFDKGWMHFVPFVVTIAAILFTDLLKGIAVGMVVGLVFVLVQNARGAMLMIVDGNNYLVRAKKDLFFIHKMELKQTLDRIPADAAVLIDLTRASFIDLDNVEILKDFMINARYKGIRVSFKNSPEARSNPYLSELYDEAA